MMAPAAPISRASRGATAAALLLWAAFGAALLPLAAQEEAPPVPAPRKVAVLPLEYEEQGDSRIGQRIGELLAASLALNPSLQVFDPERSRSEAGRSLPRMGEVTRGEVAAALGTQLGVESLVTGQAYAVGERFYVVAKVVGCNTGRVFAAGAEGALSAPLNEIVEALAPGVDDLISERRLELTLPGSKSRQLEESLAARVRAMKRQKEPPPVILLVAGPEGAAVASAGAAQDRLSLRVRRIGMTARPQRSQDLAEWAREVHAGRRAEVPGPLRGQGLLLVLLLQVDVEPGQGALSVARAAGNALWLDARDGTRMTSAQAMRDAVGQGVEAAAGAASRRLGEAVFEESFPDALGRWEARHLENEEPAAAASASPP
jgi:TolB-like protein